MRMVGAPWHQRPLRRRTLRQRGTTASSRHRGAPRAYRRRPPRSGRPRHHSERPRVDRGSAPTRPYRAPHIARQRGPGPTVARPAGRKRLNGLRRWLPQCQRVARTRGHRHRHTARHRRFPSKARLGGHAADRNRRDALDRNPRGRGPWPR